MTEFKIYHLRISKIHTLPVVSCAYVITHTIDNVHVERYIGSTTNFHSRMYGHFKRIIYIDLYVTNDIYVARSLERILMYIIKPTTNGVLLSLLDKDKDFMKYLLENNIIKKEYISSNIIKIGYRYLKYNVRIEIIKEYKSVSVPIELYNMVIEKQQELINKNGGKHFEINYVAGSAILLGIDKVE